MAELTVRAKIDNYIKAHYTELRQAEKESGTPLTEQQLLVQLRQKNIITQEDWNAYYNSGEDAAGWTGNASCLDKYETAILTGGGSLSKSSPKAPSDRQTRMEQTTKENSNVCNALYNTIKTARTIIADYLENPDFKNKVAQNGHFVLEQFGASTSAESVLKKMDDMLAAAVELKSSFNNNKQFAYKLSEITGQTFDRAAVEEFSKYAESAAFAEKTGIKNVNGYKQAFAKLFGPEITGLVEKVAQFVNERQDNALRDAVGTAIGYFAFGTAAQAAAGVSAVVKTAVATPAVAVACSADNDEDDPTVRKDNHTTMVAFQVNDFSSVLSFMINHMLPQLQAIANNTATTANNTATTNQILNDLKIQLKTDAEGIIKLLMTNNKFMEDIYNSLSKVEKNTDTIAAKMIEVAASLVTVNELLDKINTNVINLPSNIQQALQADLTDIKVAIEKGNATLASLNSNMQRIGARISGQLSVLIAQGHYSLKNQQIIISLLDKIKNGQGDQTQLMLDMVNLLKHIDQGVGNINNQVAESLNNDWKIIQKLDNLDQNDQNTQIILQNIYEAMQDIPDNLKPFFEDYFKRIIMSIDNNTSTNTAEIESLKRKLDQLNLNVTQVASFAEKIFNKLNVNAPDYTKQLDTIINLLGSINPSAGVDLSKIEALLSKVVTGVNNNGELLKKITEQNDIVRDIIKSFKSDVISTVKSFQVQVDGKMQSIDAWLEKIYAKIPAGGSGGCSIDFDALMAKLNEILAAIKDHDVVVTIEGGKCCCCVDDQPVHEGVLGNLDDILG